MTPRARIDNVDIEQLADELLVYDRDHQKAHSLNRVAAVVWQHCDGTRSASDIAAVLQAEVHAEANEDVVELAVRDLDRAHLLQQAAAPASRGREASRREAVRNIGLALIVPVVLSVAAPSVAQAASASRAGEQGGKGKGLAKGKGKGKGKGHGHGSNPTTGNGNGNAGH